MFAETASKSKSSTSIRVFGFGGGQKFNEKAATEVMREAIKEVAAKVASLDLKPKKPAGAASGKSVIADVEGNTLTLNKGTNAGFKPGQVLVVKRKGKVIKDPSTGQVLKIKYKTIGKIKLTEVDSSYSEATVVSGSGFRVGDVIR